VTLKTRVAYGWANRPPLANQKDGGPTSSYVSGDFVLETVNQANPDLLPGKQHGLEYGLDLFLGNFLSLNVTAYNQVANHDIFNTQIEVDTTTLPVGGPAPYQETTVNKYINIGEVQTKGVELTANVQWHEWSLQSTYSTSSNIIRSIPPQEMITATYGDPLKVGDRFPWVPTYTGRTQLSYTTAQFSANIGADYEGRVQANDQLDAFNRSYGVPSRDGPPLPGRSIILGKWTKYDLNMSQRINRNLEGFMNVQNIGNNMRIEGMDTRAPLSGRQYYFGVRITQ
jgi:outer membrane receptor protein involved in Fe transport